MYSNRPSMSRTSVYAPDCPRNLVSYISHKLIISSYFDVYFRIADDLDGQLIPWLGLIGRELHVGDQHRGACSTYHGIGYQT